jgi:ADP-ribose pyrophosphatase YjhB (NUDIX family)
MVTFCDSINTKPETKLMDINFCSYCGGRIKQVIPPFDDRQRDVCESCAKIHYENPKMVVGCIPVKGGQVLLCRRAIEPRIGKWTLPAGYLEKGETVAAGACRETMEEARAEVAIIAPYSMYNITFVNQIYLFFRAQLLNEDFGPGPESSEVLLFTEEEVPWDEIAFTVVQKTLHQFFKDRQDNHFEFYIGDIDPM